ncbi:MAG: DUF503 domain-containing protein [Eubacteriales bacterium]|nr:DUF503 domain-containing protein [Eubacteriales bacterium]
MYASCFEVSFRIGGAASLKDKRMVIKSIKERCKYKFNVSVVECGDTEKWQTCRMGFALAAVSAGAADQNTQKIIDYLYGDDRIEIFDIERV